jgi:pimeloyl-ACP methyl ester carboxylesterase
MSIIVILIIIFNAEFLISAEQVQELKVKHYSGQTFITWKEVSEVPSFSKIIIRELKAIKSNMDKKKKIRYKIYTSRRQITSVSFAKCIAEVPPLTCWNTEYYGAEKNDGLALRYVIDDGKEPIPADTGIYVYNPPASGPAYYAVTVSIDGKENTKITEENSLSMPIEETVGRGVPILQRVEMPSSFNYVNNPTLYYYVRWEAPPNCSISGKPFDYVVAVPPNLKKPAPVGIHLHCWGANLNGEYGWWYNAEKGAILIASNQVPYDWWTGYHEFFWTDKPLKTKEDWLKGVVHPYTQRRLISFLDWVATKWEVDKNRCFVAGSSMGGSGSIMLAIRFPERIAWAVSWVGVHIPEKSPQFKSSYEGVYGKQEWGVKYEDGTSVWDYFNDVWYLRKYPNKEVGFITFSNGKNDGAIGWPQAVEFYKALQETKRPHIFKWGMSGHLERAIMPKGRSERVMPLDIRVDQSLPAFTNCSLDDNPGNGDINSGDPSGQVNGYLYWETDDIVDEIDKWGMNIKLASIAPKDSCTVDLTPRRLQKLKVKSGEMLKWKNISLDDNKEIQAGVVIVDKYSLITIEKLIIKKGGNRIEIFK